MPPVAPTTPHGITPQKLIRHNFNAIYPCCRGSVNETGAGYRRFEATGEGAYQRKFRRSIRALGGNWDLTRRSITLFLANCVRIDTYMAAQLAARSCHAPCSCIGAESLAALPKGKCSRSSMEARAPASARVGSQRVVLFFSGTKVAMSLALVGAITGTRRGSRAVKDES